MKGELAELAATTPGAETPVGAAEAALLTESHPWYADGLRWLDDFIMRPDRRLGRRGAVCPFVAPALAQDIVCFTTLRSAGRSASDAHESCSVLADLFLDRFGGKPEFRSAALLAFFPDVAPEDAPAFIDGGHRLLRMPFVRRGLMIGEFHPRSTVASVHNPAFVVGAAPVPIFAVRALSGHDLMFLDRDDYPPAVRYEFVRQFDRYLGAQLGSAARARLDRRLECLRDAALEDGNR
ncbi:DUF6875 domain-containing protein [Amycolatopsis sp. SID8362]|uniref:DUF6875 domain-containing protein n=1 Tax=Amycolatopsis sp. SID8362 TaxID=2690346 RepID=UPI0013695735|nr:hypothetical protein [Amycolatopsis sp. SID8362]NBH08579.1 hypothetical protein [Amycolatopsis sp. SID8362]NED45273.1 hypothetical protein [Amycolatopsis sp. SID8362]